MLLSYDDRAE